MAKILGTSGIGSYTFAGATANTVYSLTKCGADAGAHVLTAGTDIETDKTRLSTILGHALGIFICMGVVSLAICFLGSGFIAETVLGDASMRVFVIIAGAIASGQVIAQFVYTAFAGMHDFSSYARVVAMFAPFTLICTVGGALLAGPIGATTGLAIGQCATAAGLFIALSRYCRSREVHIRPSFSKSGLLAILSLGLPFYLGGLLNIPVDYIAQTALARYHGMSALGELRVVAALTALLSFIPTATAGPLISSLTRAHTAGVLKHLEASLTSAKVLWLLAMVITPPLSLFWPELIVTIFGSEFTAALGVGRLALAASLLGIVSGVFASALFSARRVVTLFSVGLVQTLAFGALAFILIPGLGIAAYFLAQIFASAGFLFVTAAYLVMKGQLTRATQNIMLAAVVLSTLILVLNELVVGERVMVRAATATAESLVVIAFAVMLLFDEQQLASLRTLLMVRCAHLRAFLAGIIH